MWPKLGPDPGPNSGDPRKFLGRSWGARDGPQDMFKKRKQTELAKKLDSGGVIEHRCDLETVAVPVVTFELACVCDF